MSLFTRCEYKETYLPFIYVEDEEEFKSGVVSIEAFGEIDGIMRFFDVSYSIPSKYSDEEYDFLVGKLKENQNQSVRVSLKYKKDKLKDFTIDLASLAMICNDERFKDMEIIAWGINEKSLRDLR